MHGVYARWMLQAVLAAAVSRSWPAVEFKFRQIRINSHKENGKLSKNAPENVCLEKPRRSDKIDSLPTEENGELTHAGAEDYAVEYCGCNERGGRPEARSAGRARRKV